MFLPMKRRVSVSAHGNIDVQTAQPTAIGFCSEATTGVVRSVAIQVNNSSSDSAAFAGIARLGRTQAVLSRK